MAKKNSAKRLARLERRRLRRQLKRHYQAVHKSARWCAELSDIPGGYNRHHRLPKSRHGSNSKSNISVVPIRAHQAYNAIFGGNPTADEVVQQLNDRWIDPAYEIEFYAVPKGDFRQCPENVGPAFSLDTKPTTPAPPATSSPPVWSVLSEPSLPVKPRCVWSSSRHYLRSPTRR
jgi:hypothetical protein